MYSLADVTSRPAVPLTERQALLRQRQQGPQRITQPVALIGPGDAPLRECEAAYAIAAGLAAAGMAVLCGGRGGVMQAAAQGAAEAGGIVIGLLPEEDTRAANPYLTVALPTGLGEMRNALIARSAICLVSVGNNLGTLSEMAMGLKWGKPLFSLYPGVQLEGMSTFQNVDDLLAEACDYLLQSSTPATGACC